MEWYYSSNGEQKGPVKESELKDKVRSGEVAPGELIWRDGMGDWQPVSKVPEMAVALPGNDPAPEPAVADEAAPGSPPPAPPESAPVSPSPAAPVSAGTPPPGNPEGSGKATASMVLGICSIPGACIPCIGLICGILAIIFARQFNEILKSNPALESFASKANAGKITGIIGLILSVIVLILNIISVVVNGSLQYSLQ